MPSPPPTGASAPAPAPGGPGESHQRWNSPNHFLFASSNDCNMQSSIRQALRRTAVIAVVDRRLVKGARRRRPRDGIVIREKQVRKSEQFLALHIEPGLFIVPMARTMARMKSSRVIRRGPFGKLLVAERRSSTTKSAYMSCFGGRVAVRYRNAGPGPHRHHRAVDVHHVRDAALPRQSRGPATAERARHRWWGWRVSCSRCGRHGSISGGRRET